MTDTIFDSSGEDHNQTNPLDALVGDGKKFKTVEELAKGKLASDEFIQTLQAENAALKAEVTARARLEEVVDRLTSQRTNDQDEDSYQQDRSSQSSQPAIEPDAIERLIEKTITRRETERTARQNRELTKQKLAETFGTDFVSKLEQRREELGLDRSDMDALAARSPTAFMALVAPKTTPAAPFVPPRSSANSASLGLGTHSTAPPGSKAYYDAIKKADERRYWSPEVQFKMHQDAIKAAREGREF